MRVRCEYRPSYGLEPSSGASRHLLPEGEGAEARRAEISANQVPRWRSLCFQSAKLLLGTGKRFFAEGTPPCSFELVCTNAFPSGIILSSYKRLPADFE